LQNPEIPTEAVRVTSDPLLNVKAYGKKKKKKKKAAPSANVDNFNNAKSAKVK